MKNTSMKVLSTLLAAALAFSLFAGAPPAAIAVAELNAPTNLTATTGPGSVTLKWTNNSPNADGFYIVKSYGGGNFGDTFYVDSNTTTYVDNAVEEGYTYSYYVVAFIRAPEGYFNYESARSNTVIAILGGVAPTTSFFTKNRPYKQGMFTDVDEDEWYGFDHEGSIADAYEYSLMNGTGASSFSPLGNMTVGQAITIAARVNVIYLTAETDHFTEGTPWYRVYVDYALDLGIIHYGDFTDFERPATRAEMAYIFAHAIPSSEFSVQNTVIYLPDVNSTTPHCDEIFMLYEAGVLTGSDAQGKFSPNNNVTRAEAATIITRVILPSSRVNGRTYG